jgi:hypothetical protein
MNLFINQSYIYKRSVIDSNVDFTLLEPILEITQIEDIMPILGSDFYDELEGLATPPAASLTGTKKTLVDKYIIPCMLHYFLARATPLFKFKYTNKGVMEKNSDNSNPISSADLRMLVDEHRNLAESYKKRLIDYIKINATDFPTYFTASNTTLVLPDKEAFESTIFLPDGKDSIKPYPNWGDTRNHE